MTYEVSIDTGATGLQRFIRALLITGSALRRYMVFGRLGHGTTAVLVVEIDGAGPNEFREICRPLDLRPAQTAHVNAAQGEGERP